MDPSLLADLIADMPPDTFVLERPQDGMVYVAPRCDCGHAIFHLSGWPTVAEGRGGLFWRSVTRVWREARIEMVDGEPVHSPFHLPLFLRCDNCGKEACVLDGESVSGRIEGDRTKQPRESYRCRVCRRGGLDIVIGEVADAANPGRADYEVVARCHTCHRQARVAWSEGRPSEQEVRLDLLYGRR